MGEGATLFLGAGFLVTALGWGWYARSARRRLERIGRALDALSEGHPSESALAIAEADSGLADLTDSIGRVCAVQESLLHRIEHEDPHAARAGDQHARHQRPHDARGIHRDAVEAHGGRQQRPRDQLRHDGREHRPTQRQTDAVGEGQRQQ